MEKFVIASKNAGEVEAIVTDENPETAKKVLAAMPFKGKANFWGEEIYFEIAVETSLENGKEFVNVGDVAYWPEGRCLCIFFGKTLSSVDERPKAYSPVNVFARVKRADIFKNVKEGEEIVVRRH